jgi:hypothetical protein
VTSRHVIAEEDVAEHIPLKAEDVFFSPTRRQQLIDGFLIAITIPIKNRAGQRACNHSTLLDSQTKNGSKCWRT